jgi:hypothetical protein
MKEVSLPGNILLEAESIAFMSMKYSNDTIWNRTHHLPACSAVPQPTAPSRQSLQLQTVNITHLLKTHVANFKALNIVFFK